jgi:hypothetical protein
VRRLELSIILAVLLAVLMVPAVARADDVTVSVGSTGTVTVSSSDYIHLSGGWIEIIAPGFVRSVIMASDIDISVDGPGATDYYGSVEPADWGPIVPYDGATWADDYPSPNMPLRAFVSHWWHELGQLAAGDYEVSMTWVLTKPVVAWGGVGDPGAPPTLIRPPWEYSNTFTLHVD